MFRETEKEAEREGEKHQCVVASHASPTGDLTWSTTQACALTGNQTGDSLVHSPVLNPLSHTSQDIHLIIFPQPLSCQNSLHILCRLTLLMDSSGGEFHAQTFILNP